MSEAADRHNEFVRRHYAELVTELNQRFTPAEAMVALENIVAGALSYILLASVHEDVVDVRGLVGIFAEKITEKTVEIVEGHVEGQGREA